jgi:dihydrodipicolinate synthase/N-acetylneuraminate lyase
MNWKGVTPAITTPFNENLSIDHGFLAEHCRWLLDNGCTGVVALGSLGEGATLSFTEKTEILRTLGKAAEGRGTLVASISSLSTAESVLLAKAATDLGCSGLMVLPPYVYLGDWREMKAHVGAVLQSTPLSCMLYNNPVAYGTDFLPEQIEELAAEHDNFRAVKESSTDDAVLEAIGVGATGWVAGLANALPRESVDLFNNGIRGEAKKAFELYRWFLPLLRMDTVPKFVQLIKIVQAECEVGNTRVRPPRLELVGQELMQARNIISIALQARPETSSSYPLLNRK